MATDVKTRAVLALTRRVNATGRDLDAARVLSKCMVKLRAVEGRGSFAAIGNPAADITIHADREVLAEIRRSGADSRIRRAMRDALGETPLHRLQWVDSSLQRRSGTRAAGRDARGATRKAASVRFDRKSGKAAGVKENGTAGIISAPAPVRATPARRAAG